MLVIFTGIFLVEAFGGGFHRPTSAFFIVLFGAASIHYLAVLSRVREGFIPKPDGALLKQSTVTLGPDDVLIETGCMSTRYAWEAFVGIERAGGLIMLFIDDTAAVLLPENQLDNPDQVYQRIAGRICGGA